MNKRRRWKAKRRRAAVKASWDWVSTFKKLKAGDVIPMGFAAAMKFDAAMKWAIENPPHA